MCGGLRYGAAKALLHAPCMVRPVTERACGSRQNMCLSSCMHPLHAWPGYTGCWAILRADMLKRMRLWAYLLHTCLRDLQDASIGMLEPCGACRWATPGIIGVVSYLLLGVENIGTPL